MGYRAVLATERWANTLPINGNDAPFDTRIDANECRKSWTRISVRPAAFVTCRQNFLISTRCRDFDAALGNINSRSTGRFLICSARMASSNSVAGGLSGTVLARLPLEFSARRVHVFLSSRSRSPQLMPKTSACVRP